MKHAQLLMQLYIYGLKEENRILRRKLAETIVERDKLLKERAERDAAVERIREKIEKKLEMQYREMVGGPAPKWENPKEEVCQGLGLVVNLECES